MIKRYEIRSRDHRASARPPWIVIAAVILPALFVLCSCANRERGVRADGSIVLEYWDFPHLPLVNAYIQEAITRFEAANPGVKIRYTRLPWQDGQQKVMLSVNSGRPPDVCGQVNVSPSFIAQDMLEPLNDYLRDDLADFHPSYIEAVTFRGKIYAVPWYKACYVALLNLDLFGKFGVQPPRQGRWTWDEFVSKMRALTKYEPAEKKQYYGLVTNLGPMEYEAYSIIYNFGGRVLEQAADGRIVSGLESPRFVEGVRRLASLEFDEKVAMPGIGAMTQEQSWNVWRDTRACAVTFQGAWCITACQTANEAIERTNDKKRRAGRTSECEQPLRWAVAAPPSDGNTTPVLGSSGLGTFVVFKQNDARRRDAAARFVKHLVSGEGQRVLKYENVYPSRISTGNPWAEDPQLGPVFALFPDGVMYPLIPGSERIDKVLQQEIQKAVLRDSAAGKPQASPRQAAGAADIKVNAILERASRRYGGAAAATLPGQAP
ncbi:MAG: extracellular solute-binding protein [bacterium]